MRLICAAAVVLLGCGGSQTSESESESESETATATAVETQPVVQGTPPPGPGPREELVGRIVDRGPIGSGQCAQQSYEIQKDDGERLWIHFEACGAFDGPRFDSLESGRRYRFTVERGASPNFADDPMIVGAEPLAETAEPPTAECTADDQCEMYAFCCACPQTPQAMLVQEADRKREQCTRVRCAACGIPAPPDTRVARCVDGACVAVQP